MCEIVGLLRDSWFINLNKLMYLLLWFGCCKECDLSVCIFEC